MFLAWSVPAAVPFQRGPHNSGLCFSPCAPHNFMHLLAKDPGGMYINDIAHVLPGYDLGSLFPEDQTRGQLSTTYAKEKRNG